MAGRAGHYHVRSGNPIYQNQAGNKLCLEAALDPGSSWRELLKLFRLFRAEWDGLFRDSG